MSSHECKRCGADLKTIFTRREYCYPCKDHVRKQSSKDYYHNVVKLRDKTAQAAAESKEGEIDLLILLAHSPIHRPQDLIGNKLFIVSIGDELSRSVKQQYEAAPKPKKLVVLEGKLTPTPRNQSDSVSASLRVWYAPRSYFGGAPTFPRYHRLKDDGCKFLGPIYARLWHWTQWAASGINSNRSGGMSRPQRAHFP